MSNEQVQHATTGKEFFSLADTAQYEEDIIEGYRGDLDANAMLPPLPHDVYAVRIRYSEYWPAVDGHEPALLASDPARRWAKQVAKDGVLMYLTWIDIITENNADPANDGRERREVMTTYPTKRGTTGTQAMLQGLGVDTTTLNSHQAQMKAVDQAIAGEGGMAGIEYDWEATVFDKNMVQRDKQGNPIVGADGQPKTGVELWRLRGMKKFPKMEDGSYNPEICKDDGHLMKGPDEKMIPVVEARARNFYRRWVPIGKLQEVTNTEQQLTQSLANVQNGVPVNTPAPVSNIPPPAPVRQPVQQPVQQQQQQPVAPQMAASAAGAGVGQPARPPARVPVRRVAG